MTARATVGVRIAEDLRGAAGVLNSAGWSREIGLHDLATGEHDITGAIYVSTGYHQRDESGVYRAHRFADGAGRRASACIAWLVQSLPTNTVWEFNDRVCNSRNDAVDTLLRSADAAEARLRTHRDVERLLP